jgi:hypothetical protein
MMTSIRSLWNQSFEYLEKKESFREKQVGQGSIAKRSRFDSVDEVGCTDRGNRDCSSSMMKKSGEGVPGNRGGLRSDLFGLRATRWPTANPRKPGKVQGFHLLTTLLIAGLMRKQGRSELIGSSATLAIWPANEAEDGELLIVAHAMDIPCLRIVSSPPLPDSKDTESNLVCQQ